MRLKTTASAALLASAALQSAAVHAQTTVPVDGGHVSGSLEADAIVYRGIPFAAPPTGANRWRAPQPVAEWSGVRAASAFGPDCAQKPVPGDEAPLSVTPAEDCLYLNVWSPTAAKAKPVIVWLYGGGFVNGGSSPAVYSGASFARDGVVMVSFNYRLGRLGTFAHPALGKTSPNFALMDQIAALEWVKRNIAQFGGDPANVTIFGESAGGQAVHLLLASPAARGLFHRAIVQSGFGGDGARNPLMPIRTIDAATKAGVAFATENGIKGSDAKAAAALRALPVESVVGDVDMTTMMTTASYTGPIIDGALVPQSPWTAHMSGKSSAVPLIIGANGAEGMATGKTKQQIFSALGPFAAVGKALYDPQGSAEAGEIETMMMGDRLMLETTRTIATVASRRQPVWQYRFDYVAGSMTGEWKYGAPHATEIPYVMDTVAARYGDKLTPADVKVASLMHGYWVNFATNGDPNGPGLPQWPRYDADQDAILLVPGNGVATAADDPAKARIDAVHALLPQ